MRIQRAYRALPPCSLALLLRLILSTGTMVGIQFYSVRILYVKRTRFLACFSPKIKNSRVFTVIRAGAGARVRVQAATRELDQRREERQQQERSVVGVSI